MGRTWGLKVRAGDGRWVGGDRGELVAGSGLQGFQVSEGLAFTKVLPGKKEHALWRHQLCTAERGLFTYRATALQGRMWGTGSPIPCSVPHPDSGPTGDHLQ